MSIECDLKIIWFWKYLNCECFFNSFKFILDLQLNTILFLNLFFLVKLFFAMTILWTSECSFKLTTQTAFHRNCSQLFMALLFTKIGKNLNWNFDLCFAYSEQNWAYPFQVVNLFDVENCCKQKSIHFC